MCLGEITEKYYTDNTYSGTGYKVFIQTNYGLLVYPVMTTERPKTKGEWNEVDKYKTVRTRSGSYEAGFHIWVSRENAEMYAERIKEWWKPGCDQETVVCKVEWKNLAARGRCTVKVLKCIHSDYEHRIKRGRVIVARSYRIINEGVEE